jgi:hypothetical protein
MSLQSASAKLSPSITAYIIEHLQHRWTTYVGASHTIPAELPATPATATALQELLWEGKDSSAVPPAWLVTVPSLRLTYKLTTEQVVAARRAAWPAQVTPAMVRVARQIYGLTHDSDSDTLPPDESLQLVLQKVQMPMVRLLARNLTWVTGLDMTMPPWRIAQALRDLPWRSSGTYVGGNMSAVRDLAISDTDVDTWEATAPQLYAQFHALRERLIEEEIASAMLPQIDYLLTQAKTMPVARAVWPRIGLVAPANEHAPRWEAIRETVTAKHPHRSKHYRALLDKLPLEDWQALTSLWDQHMLPMKMWTTTASV